MDTIVFNRVRNLMEKINNEGGRSHQRVDELQANGKLNEYFINANIDKDLKSEVTNFLNTLFNRELDKYPMYKKVLLYRSDLLHIFKYFGYEVGAYFGDSDSYHRLSRFIKDACLYYGIKCNFDSLDYYLDYYLDLQRKYDLNRDRQEEDITLKAKDNIDKYNYYMPYINKGVINYDNMDMFYIYGEKMALDKEMANSNLDGDGFGFDILGYDFKSKKEKAIEVKTGKSKEFILTPNEYHTIFKLMKYKNVDYYVYKYTYNTDLKLDIYKYDHYNDLFISVYDFNNIYKMVETDITDQKTGEINKGFVSVDPRINVKRLER